MPYVGTDRDVVDITLYTVKVHNFVITIVSISTWHLDDLLHHTQAELIKDPERIPGWTAINLLPSTLTKDWDYYEQIQGNILNYLIAVMLDYGFTLY